MVTPSTLTPDTKPAGLTGQVISYSDVAGQPDTPLPNQMVLGFPADKMAEILGAGKEALSDRELRFLKASLTGANPAIVSTLSGTGGEYTLFLDPGETILCVADSEKTPPDFPATTRGCGRTHVLPGELRRVDISSGFGEILLVEP
jgi:hypothetical protein